MAFFNIFAITNMSKLSLNSHHTVFDLHAELLAALAHPTRLEIIQLVRHQALNVTQISTMLGVRQANTSQHLALLREVGVLTSQKDGKEVYYSLRHSNFAKASDLIRAVLIEDHKDDEIGHELANLPDDLEPTVTDPVCHMQLTPSTAAHITSYDGVRHYFCGKGCLKSFLQSHRHD